MSVLLVLALVLLFIIHVDPKYHSAQCLLQAIHHSHHEVGGCNRSFIRRPFVVNNIYRYHFWHYFGRYHLWTDKLFQQEYATIQPIITNVDLGIIFTVVVLMGVLISTLATLFAVNRC